MSAVALFICTLGINKDKWKSATFVLVIESYTSLSLVRRHLMDEDAKTQDVARVLMSWANKHEAILWASAGRC